MNIFPKADIHSFEPAKKTFSTLSHNIEEISKKYSGHVKLNNLALSDSSGKATLHYDKENSGIASLYERQLDYMGIDYSMTEIIELTTLDEYCKENKIEYIDLLKMDVEGNELNVLEGSKTMLEAGKIRNIQMEFGGCNLDSRTYFRDFWNLLHEDFRVFYILADSLMEITNYRETLEIFTTVNFFFQKK